VYLFNKLCTTRYTTRRRPNKYLFYDKSQTKNGFQSIENRIATIFNDIDFDFANEMTDDCIRISLKRSLNMIVFSESNPSVPC